MATVTGMTAAAMQEIADNVVVSGEVVGTDLVLTQRDGTTIDAGYVKGDKGDDATPMLGVGDTASVDLTLTGAGTTPSPWHLTADVIEPTRHELMQLAPGYVGPGPAKVTAIGDGTGTQYGPYEWQGDYNPAGNVIVRISDTNETNPVITGHAEGNSIGGWRAIPITCAGLMPYYYTSGNWYEPLEGRNAMAVRTSMGIVSVRGLYYAAAAIPANTVLFTLPVDMRPDYRIIIQGNLSDTASYIYIDTDGTVYLATAMTAGQYISMSNVHFPASGVATWTTMTSLLNGWVDYGVTQFGPARYWVDSLGFMWLGGLLKSGTVTSGTPMWTIPSAAGTGFNSQQHMSTASFAGFGCVRFSAASSLATTMDYLAGSATWMSLSGLTYVGSTALTNPMWIPAELYLNSWAAQGPPSNMAPGYGKRADGLVFLKGLLAAGTVGSVNAHALPTRTTIKGRLLMQTASNAARGRMDIAGIYSQDVWWKVIQNVQGSNAWYSWDNMKWYAGGY